MPPQVIEEVMLSWKPGHMKFLFNNMQADIKLLVCSAKLQIKTSSTVSHINQVPLLAYVVFHKLLNNDGYNSSVTRIVESV
jgi:hypothetical protein